MKTACKNLIGRDVQAVDGDIGEVKDIYFDDERWVVRYLVVETGTWLSHRRVLVSPLSILTTGSEDGPVSVNLTQAVIATGPDMSEKEPVSRRFEIEFSKHFAYPIYWAGSGLWGGAMNPVVFAKSTITGDEERELLEENSDESHLRSVKEVSGYSIQTTNGSVGHIEDFLIDDDTWAIIDVVVDTRNWFPGKKVVIDSGQIEEISWSESMVKINMGTEEVKTAPEFDS